MHAKRAALIEDMQAAARDETSILGVARAPWVRRLDSTITLARALDVLADPAATLT